METSDEYGGFKQSEYNPLVYYAVSKSNVWDKNKIYECPEGFHWASTAEASEIFKENKDSSGKYLYYNRGGWSGYTFNGLERYYFRFCDSDITFSAKHVGHYEEFQLVTYHHTSLFAGIVCIKDD